MYESLNDRRASPVKLRPTALKAASAPLLPRSDDPAPALGGLVFRRDGAPPAAPGVFALTLAIDGTAYPILIGEGDDLARRIEEATSRLPALPATLGVGRLEPARRASAPMSRAILAANTIRRSTSRTARRALRPDRSRR